MEGGADPADDALAALEELGLEAQDPADSDKAEEPAVPWDEQLVRALTWARTKPLEVAEEIRKRLPHYKGKDYCGGPKGRVLVTKEGTAAVQDALSYLERQEVLEGVGETSIEGLAFAGEDHIADIGRTGTASHSSSDGTGAAERVMRYGSFGSFGECLWYGSDEADARQVVLDLIIDDGVPSRGHRLGIYTKKYDCVGVARGDHCTFGRLVALEFACGWSADEDAVALRRANGPLKLAATETEAAKTAASTQWKNLGTCLVCQEPIKGGRTVEIQKLQAKLHAACFQCSECACQLNGNPYQVQSKTLFCNPCYYEKYGEKCTACGQTMQNGILKCSLGKFHLECIICSVCDTKIGKAPFSTSTGAIVCKACEAKADEAAGAPDALAMAAAPSRGRMAAKASVPARGGAAAIGMVPPKALGAPAVKAAGGPPAKAGAKAGAKAKAGAPKAKARVSFGKAGATVVGLGMDYASLG